MFGHFVHECGPLRVHNHGDFVNARSGFEGVDAAFYHCPSVNLDELFGFVGAHAGTRAARQNDSDVHGISILGLSGRRVRGKWGQI